MRFDATTAGNQKVYQVIEQLLHSTFDSPFEAELVQSLRDRDALVCEHLYWDNERLVGHIAYSRPHRHICG